MTDLNQILDFCIETSASDIHLTVGRPPVLRQGGRMKSIQGDPLQPTDTEAMAMSIIPSVLTGFQIQYCGMAVAIQNPMSV